MPKLFSNPLRYLRPERGERMPERPNAVLLVCTGNVCRSPMAEALLRGLLAPVGAPADPHAVELMSERGLDITTHRARQLTAKILDDFPVVLVMDAGHRELMASRFRAARDRTWRIGEWSEFDVPDPIGGERLDFERALVLIDQGLADWVDRLWPPRAK
jgi:protein-tyrosine phosphatase